MAAAQERPKPVVVVTGDFLGDRVASSLETSGCAVVRGPRPSPGRLMPALAVGDWERVLPVAECIVVSPRDSCTREMILKADRLRGIVSTVIGVDTIDMDAVEERGLVVGHGAMPENYVGVAEATVMFIAALSLELRRKEALIRGEDRLPVTMFGQMVHGQTVGLIGFGRVGRAVADRLAGWEVRILVADPYVPPDPRVAIVDLHTLLRESDFVSVHTTLNGPTHHLLGRGELEMMKPTAYLINTARGAVIDEGALVDALEAGRLAGAALDVFEQEPLATDSRLRALGNVFLTPHMIGHSMELLEAIGSVAAENVMCILRGTDPLYVRNPEALARWRSRFGPTA